MNRQYYLHFWEGLKFAKLKCFFLIVPFVFSLQITSEARSYYYPTRLKSNIVNVELLGNAVLWSINYERIIIQGQSSGLSLRIGYGGLKAGALGENQNRLRMIPIELMGLTGKKHHFEYGFGVTNRFEYIKGYDERIEYSYNPTLRMGYRYQAKEERLFFRVGCTCFFNLKEGFPLWPGTAIGFAF
jgi:hypothetical protein